jgi:WD40 repeat protein
MLATAFVIMMAAITVSQKVEAQNKPAFKVSQYLQDISVTVRAGQFSGSGVMVQTSDGQIWIWTAAHVTEPLRRTHEVLDDKGVRRLKVEFDDANILRFNKNKEEGRIVSSYSGDAEVIRYSDSKNGHDLCLLRLRDKDFKPNSSAKFYLEKGIPDIGEDLYHCGSLLGPIGSNSLTSGIMSQHGRVFDGRIYDQTTATSFPGSSGGIVCLKLDGRYVGMLVMGAGEGFGLIVPVRRMIDWSKKTGVEFALDPAVKVPTDEELRSKPIEDGVFSSGGTNQHKQREAAKLKFMLNNHRDD